MFISRGNIIDFWKEDLGTPYWLYLLIDPRTDTICYIGKKQSKILKIRLHQHRNPIKNKSS